VGDVEGVCVEDVEDVCVEDTCQAFTLFQCDISGMPIAHVGVGRQESILGNLLPYTVLQFYETTVSSITEP